MRRSLAAPWRYEPASRNPSDWTAALKPLFVFHLSNFGVRSSSAPPRSARQELPQSCHLPELRTRLGSGHSRQRGAFTLRGAGLRAAALRSRGKSGFPVRTIVVKLVGEGSKTVD